MGENMTSDSFIPISTDLAISSSASTSPKKIRAFDCAICRESLETPGPPLSSFTFGKLLINVDELMHSERQFIYREFTLVDLCFTNGIFDCEKILATPCGHLFHSGCIREWFFVRRLDRYTKCPYCNQNASYDECFIINGLSGTSQEEDGVEGVDPSELKTVQESPCTCNCNNKQVIDPLDYSDISCTSSTWSSDSENEDDPGDDQDQNLEEEEGTVDHDEPIHHFEDEMPITETTEIDTEIRNKSSKDEVVPTSFVRDLFGCIDRFNIVYFFLLFWTKNLACQCYQKRKEIFYYDLDNMEDEEFVKISENLPIPLGYDIVVQFFFTLFVVFIYEKCMNFFRTL